MPVNEFDNSRPLDVHRWSEFPPLAEFTRLLANELFPNIRRDGLENRQKHLRVVLVDLLHCYRTDPTQYIGYSRNKNSYAKATRYDKLHIEYAPLIDVFDALSKAGYTEGVPGFRDPISGIGRQTRVRMTQLLADKVLAIPDIDKQPLSQIQDVEIIVMKDINGDEEDYVDDDHTNQMRKRLQAYNKFIAKSYIDVNLLKYSDPTPRIIDLTHKTVRRIFANSDWKQGGRFYGGWWEYAPRGIRQRILINYKQTKEIDFSAFHVVIAYALMGLDYWGGTDQDPYMIEWINYENDAEKHRNLNKLVLLTVFNSLDYKKARAGIQMDINFDSEDSYPQSPDIDWAMETFMRQHEAISKFFFSGQGMYFQWLDSCIADRVIAEFVRNGRPILPIHDSFICQLKDSEMLEACLAKSLNIVLDENGYRSVTPKFKYVNPIEHPTSRDELGAVIANLKEIFARYDPDQLQRASRWEKTKLQERVQTHE